MNRVNVQNREIMELKWEENSVLNKISKYTSPKEIFDAVYMELLRYYSDKAGFKPTKRKLKWTGTNVICEFAFWSSRSNMAGEYVAFEIVTSVYAKDKTDMEKKGLLYIHIRPKRYDVHDIDSDKFLEITDFIGQTVEYIKKRKHCRGLKNI